MTDEEISKKIIAGEKRLNDRKAQAWSEAEKTIRIEMEKQKFGTFENRDAFVLMIQLIWVKGYSSGSQNMMEECYEQMGLGDTLKNIRSMMSFKPENN